MRRISDSNPAGRPLEFHCTTPLKPNRAQEILYGPTLESFLYGEQIGRTLIQQGGESPLVVFTDAEPVLCCARLRADATRAGIARRAKKGGEGESREMERPGKGRFAGHDRRSAPLCPIRPRLPPGFRLDGPHSGPRLISFELGRNRVAVPARLQQDRQLTVDALAGLADAFDLAEPFGRIRDAIEEARQAAR